MTVYLLWGWDSMASNWGEQYLDGIYATYELADSEAKRKHVMSPKIVEVVVQTKSGE